MECGNNFLIVGNGRVCELKKAGINLSLTSFRDHGGNKIEIGFSLEEEEKIFTVSTEGGMFFLENPEYRKPGGRPTFIMIKDMIDYLLVLTNGGQVAGKLMIPGESEEKFEKELVVVPT